VKEKFKKEMPELSTDITKNRRINYIKNMIRDSDEDIFMEYMDQGEDEEKVDASTGKLIKRKSTIPKKSSVLRSKLW